MKNIIILLIISTLLSCNQNKTETLTPVENKLTEHEIFHINSSIKSKIKHRKNNVRFKNIFLNDTFHSFKCNGNLTKFHKESNQWYGNEYNITYKGYYVEDRDYTTKCYYKFDIYVTDTIINHKRELKILDVQNDNIFFTEYKVNK